jgi:hypothetical protein
MLLTIMGDNKGVDDDKLLLLTGLYISTTAGFILALCEKVKTLEWRADHDLIQNMGDLQRLERNIDRQGGGRNGDL